MIDTETQLDGLLLFHQENNFIQNPFKNISSDGHGNTTQVINENDIPNPKDLNKFIEENNFKVILFLNEFELINNIQEIPNLYNHLSIKKFNDQPLLKTKEDGIIEITTAGKLFMASGGFTGERDRIKMEFKLKETQLENLKDIVRDYPDTIKRSKNAIVFAGIAILLSILMPLLLLWLKLKFCMP